MKSTACSISAQPSLGDLRDLSQQLQRDADVPGSSLRHRDRRIGRELVACGDKPAAQIKGWLQEMRALTGDLRGDRVNVMRRLGLLALGVAGLFVGWGAAAVVLRYDGSQPVNIIHFLAVFVVLQLVTLVFFGISMLPPAVTRFLPGMTTVQEGVGLLSPGRLQHLMNRFLPQAYRDTTASLVGKGLAHHRLYGKVDRWVVVHSSQFFACCFNLGALASCLYLVTFSDLAFSWSTTLQLDATDFKRWTDILSAPWAPFFADARPSLELIERTRYFRLNEGTFPTSVTPAGLGGWWPFLVMCLAVYGLLPRLVTLLATQLRLRSVTRRTFLHLPGVADLLVRLNTELVETQAAEPETGGGPRREGSGTPVGQGKLTGQAAEVVNWAAAADDPDSLRIRLREVDEIEVGGWHEAGGATAPAVDEQVIAATRGSSVMILVKGWEPPMEDFLDFLRALRRSGDPQRALHVTPLGAEPNHLIMWQKTLSRLGDPWLTLSRLEGEDS